MVHDVDTNKPRGYAFIEYEHERDMHCKYLPSTHRHSHNHGLQQIQLKMLQNSLPKTENFIFADYIIFVESVQILS